jgi:hypothetical protein
MTLERKPVRRLICWRCTSIGLPQWLQISLLGPVREGDTIRQPHWGHGMRISSRSKNLSLFQRLWVIDYRLLLLSLLQLTMGVHSSIGC